VTENVFRIHHDLRVRWFRGGRTFHHILPSRRALQVLGLWGLVFLGSGCDDEKSSQADRAASAAIGSETAVVEDAQRKKSAKPKPANKLDQRDKSKVAKGAREISPARLDPERAIKVAEYMGRLRQRDPAERKDNRVNAGAKETGELLATLKVAGAVAVAGAEADRVLALQELGGRDDPGALDLLRAVASSTERPAEERIAALEALAELPRAEHLPAVTAALEAANEEVRAAGVWLLTQIQADSALPLWQRVMSDASPELVTLAFAALPEAPERLQVEAAATALRRGEPWITEQSLLVLGGITSKKAVEALIPMVDHATSGDLAHDGLMFLVGESFENSSSAQRWWLANKGKLDETLQPLELALPEGSQPVQPGKKADSK
jgi:hypothetical protein